MLGKAPLLLLATKSDQNAEPLSLTYTMTPVFIIAAPRSGTTWLVRALNAHPETYASELRAFGDYVDLVRDNGASKPRLRIALDKYVDALLQAHQWGPLGPSSDAVRNDLLHDIYQAIAHHALRRSGKPLFIDKLTPYPGTAAYAVESIARTFPGAKVIMLVRDGRDVAVSTVMHWLTKQRVGDPLSHQQQARRAFFLEKATEPLQGFFEPAELEGLACSWREVLDAITAQGTALTPMVVRYEDMWKDLASELRRICEFIGADTSDAVIQRCVDESTFEAMSGGRRRGDDAPGQHVRKGVVGDWRTYFTAADAAQFHRDAGRCLIEHGYEQDQAWTMQVQPELLLTRQR